MSKYQLQDLDVEVMAKVMHTVLGFNALTASLCSANRVVAVNCTQRMGILNSRASLIQCNRVSLLAFVLSVNHMVSMSRQYRTKVRV
jgi:hypothetical protein